MAAETTIQACRLIKTFINECILDMYLSSIRPSTQHGLTTITTWFNNNNKWHVNMTTSFELFYVPLSSPNVLDIWLHGSERLM